MLTDTLADTLTRIRNAQRAGHKLCRVKSSNMIRSFLQVLKDEGYISEFEVKKDANDKFDEVEVELRYLSDGHPAIIDAQRVSTSGRRVYANSSNVPQVEHGLGLAVISTSKGVMADRVARKSKIGGEVLAYIR